MKRNGPEDDLERRLRSLAPPARRAEETERFRVRVLARAGDALLSRGREVPGVRPAYAGSPGRSPAEILSGWARILVPAAALTALLAVLALGPLVDRWSAPGSLDAVRTPGGSDPVALAVTGAPDATVVNAILEGGPSYVYYGD